jgi:hypothetical protein
MAVRAPPFMRDFIARCASTLLLSSFAVGVGQDKQSPPLVRRPNFCRRIQSRLNSVTKLSKFGSDVGESQSKVACDVLEEAPAWLYFLDNASKVGPQVPRIALSKAFPCNGERLARVAARDNIHESTPWSAVEGGNIVPDRRPIQGLVFHPCHERSRGVGFPLDVTNSSVSFPKGKMEPEFEPSNPGT